MSFDETSAGSHQVEHGKKPKPRHTGHRDRLRERAAKGGLSALPALYEELPKRLPGHLLPGVALPAIREARFGGAGGVRGAALLNL